MLASHLFHAIGWRSVINTDYDGAVLVGGLENELRHFVDPDEEHDFWGEPQPIQPCPYTHEGARAIAAEKKKEKKRLLKASRASALRVSKYGNDVSGMNYDETLDDDEEESEDDGCTVEGDGDPLKFHNNWFGGNLSEENNEVEVEFKGCPVCGGIPKEKIANDSEETPNCTQNKNDMVMITDKDSDTRIYFEEDESNLDPGESFILMDFDTASDVEEAKDIISTIEPSNRQCSCASDFTFVKIDTNNTINGMNGIEKGPGAARAVIAAQPGLWRAMTACRPFERACRPHIIRPGN